MRKSLILALAAVVLVITGCSPNTADEPTRSSGENGYVGVPKLLTQIKPADRKPAPTVSGPELGTDKTISTADFAGKVIVINVWGSWCPPCRKEAPDLQAASVRTKDKAQFLGITTKDVTPAAPQAFVRANKITYPSIFDPDGATLLAFARDVPPSAIPSTLIIDTEGRVAVRILGEITETTLVAMIDDVAAGK
ncbi:TlpA family protein disulfide reductase [Microlunatus speluncae]|uniref:TlpA family protein disulfide reductase n=1 Tax=Microlunatus speluncae TaxID=2594267 RepID=UPI0012662245|nr:TlpA disulfide reductase family protein [Microlunatus speluncae]